MQEQDILYNSVIEYWRGNWTVSDVIGHVGVTGQYLENAMFQINQSEDSSKITIMSDNTSIQLHQRSITSAFNYNRITLRFILQLQTKA